MLKTLHWFLARELAKVALLSLVAFTLVMTVFVIIEPMRKQGLSSDQVVGLFGYTVPMMLTLTLPVAALFAATIVYGRFSQDNELLACRAGGIATLTLLKPAMVLGLLVTAASLWLSNSVTPYLAEKAEKAVKSDIRSIAAYQLRKQGHVRREGYILHADHVVTDRDDPAVAELHGVVLVSARPPKDPGAAAVKDANEKSPYDILLVAASKATATFPERDFQGEAYVGVHMVNPVFTRTSWYNIVQEDEAPIDSMPLRSPIKDDPAWYSWRRLLQTLENPAMNAGVQRSLRGLCTDIGHEMLVAEVVEEIEHGRPYTKLRGRTGQVELWAPRAERGTKEAELLASEGPSGRRVPVRVRIVSGNEVRVMEADRCRVAVSRSAWKDASLVSLDLEGDVRVRLEESAPTSGPGAAATSAAGSAGHAGGGEWTERESARVGDLEMPRHLAESMAKLDANMVLANVAAVSSDPAVLRRTQHLVNFETARLRGQILAEIHGRLAYGVSCFLLVAMGAALGLLCRGGQLLSAFVISMGPAFFVIILILMGKQMLGNIRVPPSYGVAAMWGGIAAVLAANLGLYANLARK